jgi:hypothetical protein
MGFAGRPPTLHLTLSAATAAGVPDLLDALAEGVLRAREAGPVAVDPDVAAFVAALDPETLGDEDFDGLLAAAGMAPGTTSGAAGAGEGPALPDRMAEVNALLDAAPPRLREAVLTAFLDRLMRPVRGGWSPPPVG